MTIMHIEQSCMVWDCMEFMIFNPTKEEWLEYVSFDGQLPRGGIDASAAFPNAHSSVWDWLESGYCPKHRKDPINGLDYI